LPLDPGSDVPQHWGAERSGDPMLPAENAAGVPTMRQRLWFSALVVALAAALGFGLAWRSTDQSRARFENYSRRFDQCRLQPDADLRLNCFDNTLRDQPGD
jgi:hypothetical protein